MLHTDRLVLRPHRIADLEMLRGLDTDADARRFVGGVADEPTTLRYLQIAIASFGEGDWKFAIEIHDTGEAVGWCWLKSSETLGGYEIGYQITRAHWGHGIAAEAADGVLRAAFEEFGLDCVYAIVDPANTASCRVIEKLNFSRYTDRVWDCPSGVAQIFIMIRASYRCQSGKSDKAAFYGRSAALSDSN